MLIENTTIWLAFVAGIFSFLSPCVLALVPAYIGYLGGRAAGGAADASFNQGPAPTQDHDVLDDDIPF